MDAKIKASGTGTASDPIQYEVNEALCEAVKRGEWTSSMLDALADWALERLKGER